MALLDAALFDVATALLASGRMAEELGKRLGSRSSGVPLEYRTSGVPPETRTAGIAPAVD